MNDAMDARDMPDTDASDDRTDDGAETGDTGTLCHADGADKDDTGKDSGPAAGPSADSTRTAGGTHTLSTSSEPAVSSDAGIAMNDATDACDALDARALLRGVPTPLEATCTPLLGVPAALPAADMSRGALGAILASSAVDSELRSSTSGTAATRADGGA
jgi:hypothetical protein